MDRQKLQKSGKRISITDLLKFIKTNAEAIKSIGCVDLNDVSNDDMKLCNRIDQLQFQDIKRVTFLPLNLNKIFDIEIDKYLHAGVLHSCSPKDKNDVTLYSAVLSCLRSSFLSQPESHQSMFIQKFIERFKLESKTKFETFEYKKLKWNKNDLYDDIYVSPVGKNIIKYMADYFHINIFVLDIEDDELYFCNGELFIPYKKNVFLIRYSDGTFEPFFTEQSRTMSYNDKIIKKLSENTKLMTPFSFTNSVNLTIKIEDENLDKYQLKSKLSVNKQDEPVKKVDVDQAINNHSADQINGYAEISSEEENQDKIIETIKKVTPMVKSSDKSARSSDDSSSDPDSITNNLWVKKTEPENNNSNSQKKSPMNINMDLNMKMKLTELKTLARKYKVSDIKIDGIKKIAKTKSQLIEDIKKVMNKKK